MHRKNSPRVADRLAAEFGLIGQAFVEAFRGMASSSRFDSRRTRMSCCSGGAR